MKNVAACIVAIAGLLLALSARLVFLAAAIAGGILIALWIEGHWFAI